MIEEGGKKRKEKVERSRKTGHRSRRLKKIEFAEPEVAHRCVLLASGLKTFDLMNSILL